MDPDAQAAKTSLYPPQETRVIISASVESIQTKNLQLRPLQLPDAADLFEFRSRQCSKLTVRSPTGRSLCNTTNYLAYTSWPRTPHKNIEETKQMISKKTFETPDASGAVGRQFNFAVIRANEPDQKVIGAVGVDALVPAPSLGYGLHPDFWGRGYVSEAVAGVVDAWWKLERRDGDESTTLGSEREKLFEACNMANIGSVRVLQKNGFVQLREFHLEGDVVALLGSDI